MNILNLFRLKRGFTINPSVLLIYDGLGIAPDSAGNAVTQADMKNLKYYTANYPHTELIASGESVGLPANVVGNSEVGHLTLGAGRVIFESLVRINLSIDDGSFYENDAFIKAAKHVKQFNSTLHLMGMASSGNVHSSLKHLHSLIEFANRNKVKTVLHLFTDGRDAPTNDGLNVIRELEIKISETPFIKIGSIAGRYFAMDRDARWERIESVYKNMVLGTGNSFKTAAEAIKAYYSRAVTDEFIPPTSIIDGGSKEDMLVKDNDALIFFNYRIDRARELSMSFVLQNFERLREYDWGFELDQGNKKTKRADGPTFDREKILNNLFFVSMTEYQKQLPVGAIGYPPPTVTDSLPEVIDRSGLDQFHLAESEKERMVTYYFDGLRTDRFTREDVEIVSSPKVSTYDKKPEMSVGGLVSKFKSALNRDKYSFIVLNIANPDMVAHTGNLEATVKALKVVDEATRTIVEETLKRNGTVFMTADHGNAEELITYNQSNFFFTSDEGSQNTEHSNNPVPFIIINNKLFGKSIELKKGTLSDVAPTILSLMNIGVPKEMQGENLLQNI